MKTTGLLFGVALSAFAFSSGPALAQLKDGTPAERDMMVWATTSVGTFGRSEERRVGKEC